METTMNNLFKAAMTAAENAENDKRNKEQKALAEFLEDLRVIKKNLEDAFKGTEISVFMGMFGVKEPQYTTIRVDTHSGVYISGITSNKAVYHNGSWLNDVEEKDFRLDGTPYTYEEFFTMLAKKIAKNSR